MLAKSECIDIGEGGWVAICAGGGVCNLITSMGSTRLECS